MKELVFFAKGMIVVFALLGCGAAYFAHAQAVQAGRLAHEGVSTTATITKKFLQATTHATSSDQRVRGGTDHVVVYEFPVEGADAPQTKRETLHEETWNGLAVGQQVPVRYWAQDPKIATIQDQGFARSAAFLSDAWKLMAGLAVACAIFVKLASPKRPVVPPRA